MSVLDCCLYVLQIHFDQGVKEVRTVVFLKKIDYQDQPRQNAGDMRFFSIACLPETQEQ